MKAKWKTLTGQPVPDLDALIAQASKAGQPIHVGTDSLNTGRWTQFVTVVVVLNPPHGGRVIYRREAVPRIISLRERLLAEVWRSIEVAMSLSKVAAGDLTIHIDANSQEKHASSKWVQELVGMVVGQGFQARIKPDAWAASAIADHVVRHHGKAPTTIMPFRKVAGKGA